MSKPDYDNREVDGERDNIGCEEVLAEAAANAEEAAVNRAAAAINEFLYQISLGYTPVIAFERAVDGETATALRVPSNMSCITVVP